MGHEHLMLPAKREPFSLERRIVHVRLINGAGAIIWACRYCHDTLMGQLIDCARIDHFDNLIYGLFSSILFKSKNCFQTLWNWRSAGHRRVIHRHESHCCSSARESTSKSRIWSRWWSHLHYVDNLGGELWAEFIGLDHLFTSFLEESSMLTLLKRSETQNGELRSWNWWLRIPDRASLDLQTVQCYLFIRAMGVREIVGSVLNGGTNVEVDAIIKELLGGALFHNLLHSFFFLFSKTSGLVFCHLGLDPLTLEVPGVVEWNNLTWSFLGLLRFNERHLQCTIRSESLFAFDVCEENAMPLVQTYGWEKWNSICYDLVPDHFAFVDGIHGCQNILQAITVDLEIACDRLDNLV